MNPTRSDAPSAAKASANRDARRPKLYEELPQEASSRFTKPSITAQVYSPENVRVRFVIGDGQLTRQGETLPNGIVVEEIREEEAWFRYGNWRFRIEMEQ